VARQEWKHGRWPRFGTSVWRAPAQMAKSLMQNENSASLCGYPRLTRLRVGLAACQKRLEQKGRHRLLPLGGSAND
jgi:hypothetical protein